MIKLESNEGKTLVRMEGNEAILHAEMASLILKILEQTSKLVIQGIFVGICKQLNDEQIEEFLNFSRGIRTFNKEKALKELIDELDELCELVGVYNNKDKRK